MIKFRIRELLKERGISERQFALVNNIREDTLYALCNNKKIERLYLPILDRICEALRCTPGDVMEWIPDAEG